MECFEFVWSRSLFMYRASTVLSYLALDDYLPFNYDLLL